MSTNFKIEFKEKNGHLYVQPKGDFDGSSAWELINLIHDKYDGKGRVFIDTSNLGEIHPFGCNIFQCRLNHRTLPADRLCFKGEKGYKIAPSDSRVIIAPKKVHCRCNGNCEECSCAGKRNKFDNITNKKGGYNSN